MARDFGLSRSAAARGSIAFYLEAGAHPRRRYRLKFVQTVFAEFMRKPASPAAALARFERLA